MRIKALTALLAATSLVMPVAAIAKAPGRVAARTAAPIPAQRPNFLIIVADDLGFSDLGAFGGEIRTPNLDALARSGVRLTQFHTAPMCAPSRAMVLTGTTPIRVGLGTMMEQIDDKVRGKPGYEGYLTPQTVTLADRLAAGGYQTFMSGKWHLGYLAEHDPHNRGFQRSFALLQAGHNHFGLGINADRTRGPTYTEDGTPISTLPKDFYSSDYFADRMAGFIREADPAKPFFGYLAFTAPHSPLQAPPEDIARYKGKYDAGYDALRAQRLAAQRKLGILAPGAVAHPPLPRASGWDAMTPENKALYARNMEVFAAMVDRLDQAVGRVVAELKRTGRYDNTVIVFMSDNGPEGIDTSNTEIVPMRRQHERNDNRLENRGAATSYFSYGPGWASASAAPSWMYKSYATEGGSRTPAIVFGPRRLVGGARIDRGLVSSADIAPTFLDMARIPNTSGEFQGRKVVPITGKSMEPYLTGRAARVHAADEPLATEIYGSRSIRMGDWKITDLGYGQWGLYNIARDPGETKDLSKADPARLQRMIAAWDAYVKDTGLIMPGKRPDNR
ncbi:MAG: arylsulfatase [Novosphingobium sp.]